MAAFVNPSRMSLYAVDELTDAVDVTKGLLTPVDARQWLKLALVALFVGGGSGFPAYAFNFTPSTGGGGTPIREGDAVLVVLVLVALFVGVVVVFGVVGSVMEFVFVQALVTGDVRIRRYWSEYWRRGLRLFGFRLALALPFVLLVLAVVVAFALPLFLGVGVEGGFLLLLFAIPLFFLGAFVVGIVNGFTSVFVVPVMLADDCGVLDGWRRLWPSITDETVEYIGYGVIQYVVRLVTGTAATMVLGVSALVLLLPFGGAGLAVLAVLPDSVGVAGLLVLLLLGTAYVLALLAIWAVVLVPLESYHRYHGLLVLGDVVPDYDLVADRRPEDDDGGETGDERAL